MLETRSLPTDSEIFFGPNSEQSVEMQSERGVRNVSADEGGYYKHQPWCCMPRDVAKALDAELGFCASATGVSSIGVSREFDNIVILEL